MTSQSDLRDAIDFIKSQSGTGSKARKQEKFVDVYTESVAYLLAGERYDDAGVGPATAQSAVETAFPDLNVDDYPTISEALASDEVSTGIDTEESLVSMVYDLDEIANLSGNEQTARLEQALFRHAEPSLITIALLSDESLGLGKSQMRESFFDGTRNERKHVESFTSSTAEFIQLAQIDSLPEGPTVGIPFDPMLAVPESRGEPDNPIAQTKIDGYRVLIHISKRDITDEHPYSESHILREGDVSITTIHAFSRAKNDITESLPELHEIDWPEGDYIFDGEVIAETGSYSDTSQRIGRDAENVDRDVEMNFKIFDCVVALGEDISDDIFMQRLISAELALYPTDDRVSCVGITKDIGEAKDRALENGDEGIIVKDMDSPYEFGKRSAYWQKQKYDAETVDVVISGFMEGDGEASKTLGAVALEAADGSHIGNSGSGFSEAQRDDIWANQDEWLGRVIEVEARGIGTQGKLRMPIFKRVRDEGEADSRERIEEVMKDV